MRMLVFITLTCLCFSLNIFAQSKVKVLKYESPGYPPAALATRKSGEVIVFVEIDKNGNVTSTKVESGHIFLAKMSGEAASKWLFSADKNSEKRNIQIIFEYGIEIGKASYRVKSTKLEIHFKKPFRLKINATVYPTIQI